MTAHAGTFTGSKCTYFCIVKTCVHIMFCIFLQWSCSCSSGSGQSKESRAGKIDGERKASVRVKKSQRNDPEQSVMARGILILVSQVKEKEACQENLNF